MNDKNSTQQQTPPDLPLTGEELCMVAPTSPLLMKAQYAAAPTSPLLRGDRGGLDFVPYNKKLTALARENCKTPTAAESKLWKELLRMRNFSNLKFSRQKPIANYIADFYCAELHLVIEIDGDSHAESLAYDAERTKALGALGIMVIRYKNEEILKNLSGVYDDLMRKISSLNEEIVKQ
ncbi:MAG: endonuclease domain-containing protein [Gallionellaceae bacterium]